MFNFLVGVVAGGAIVWVAKETVRDLFNRLVAKFKQPKF
jgi:hypothetical protein